MGLAEFDLAGYFLKITTLSTSFILSSRCDLEKSYELTLHLEDGVDDDLVKKNKKKKTLGYIVVRLVLSPLTKEEYNEVNQWDSNSLLLSLSPLLTACFFFLF